MTVEILFTTEIDGWKDGVEHLAGDGIWLRQFLDRGKKKAHLYCLNKLLLAEFADIFGLTKFERDVELYAYGHYLRTFRIAVWGKKLEQIFEWRNIAQQNAEGSEGIQGG